MILFDPSTARDVLDALRLLEGRLLGTSRTLSQGALELRAAAEGSGRVWTDQPSAPSDGWADAVVVNRLLTFDEVGQVLSQSVPSVKRLVANEELPAVHVGRSVRVRQCDLVEFIANLPTTHPKGVIDVHFNSNEDRRPGVARGAPRTT